MAEKDSSIVGAGSIDGILRIMEYITSLRFILMVLSIASFVLFCVLHFGDRNKPSLTLEEGILLFCIAFTTIVSFLWLRMMCKELALLYEKLCLEKRIDRVIPSN